MLQKNKPIRVSKVFLKHLNKRFSNNVSILKTIDLRIEMFKKSRENPLLRDHPLSGDLIGCRSFSITGDIRILYREKEDHFLFIFVGTHNQIYS